MAVGIPIHMGRWTLINLILNVLLCVLLIGLCVAGIYLWIKRRPSNVGLRLGAPKPPKSVTQSHYWLVASLVWVGVAVFVPIVGAAVLLFLVVDVFLSLINKKRATFSA